MTTAARPTYYPAVGKKDNTGFTSRHYSGKDQTAHTKLKFRQFGQSSQNELKYKDFRTELEEKEQTTILANKSSLELIENEERKANIQLLLENKPIIAPDVLKKYDDADVDDDDKSQNSFDSSSEESDDDEDDDEEELQAELERIKQERAAAQARKEQEEKEIQDSLQRESALKGNPLLNIEEGSAKVKRRWNDDVVFRNQARDEPEVKKRFINDTIRNDFHRSFLKKFMK